MRRAILAFALLLLGGGVVAGPAQARQQPEDPPFWVVRSAGCGTRHLQQAFTLTMPAVARLSVAHRPGRWGQTTITNTATGAEVWSWRQPYNWIWGSYEITSDTLAAGTYRLDYWSDNLAQDPYFCSGSVYLELP